MNAYSLGIYEKSMPHSLTLREKLSHAKSSGFDFLEVSIDETDEKLSRLHWCKAERREVVNAIWDTVVPIGSMCLSGHRKYPLGSLDEAVRMKSLDIMAGAIDLACDWGIQVIQLAGYDVYYEKGNERTRELFLESLVKSVSMAAKSGVILAFETMETPFMDTVEKAMIYVSEINSPYLQVYPDLGNLTNAALAYGRYNAEALVAGKGRDTPGRAKAATSRNTSDSAVSLNVSADMEAGRGHIAAMHLKETKPGIYRDVPYGTGHVGFLSGIKAAWRQGVRRFVGEFWDNGDYKAQIDYAHTFLRRYLDEAANG